MPRKRLFPDQTIHRMSITVSGDMLDRLKLVAASFGLEPAAYLRTLLATHLRKTSKGSGA